MVTPVTLSPGYLEGGDIRLDGVVPHPQGKEDVRGHVLRMRGCRRNLAIKTRGAQSERRVYRIVVGVNEVVQRARMVFVEVIYRFGFSGRPHVVADIAFAVTQP